MAEQTHNQEAIRGLGEDDAFFSAIGRFIFQFSQLEYSLKVTVAEAVRLPDEHFNAIMTHDFALLCTMAQNVFSKYSNKDRIDDVIGKIRKLNEDRVRIVHGLWVVSIEGGKLHHVSRNSLRQRFHFDQPRGVEIGRLADLASQLRWEWEQVIWNI